MFTWFWFCFVYRVFCSAQHKCVYLGPQQQFDGSGALHKTGFSVAKTRSQNTLMEPQVDLTPWEHFCTLEASKTVQTSVSSGHRTWEAPWDGQDMCPPKLWRTLWSLVGHDGCAEAETRRLASEMILPFLTKGQKCNVASEGCMNGLETFPYFLNQQDASHKWNERRSNFNSESKFMSSQ